jgi:2-hydroxychromene-2-carboxylate isomerase
MIDFWYDFASTYSHIAAQRIDAVASAAGETVRWRPFLLGPIFAAQGWTTSPFNLYPNKGRYMWRDMARLSAAHGMPFKKPEPFPANSLLAARVAIQGEDEGWIAPFTMEAFRAAFCEGANIADADVLRGILTDLDLDAGQVLEQARAEPVKAKLKMQTDEAARLGIFGAPSFVVDHELFWGNDRLEEAVRWAERPWIA